MGRKRRSDAQIEALDAELLLEVQDMYIHQNAGHTDVRSYVESQCGELYSLSTWHAYFHRAIQPLIDAETEAQSDVVRAIVADARKSEVPWNEASLEKFEQSAWELVKQGAITPEVLASMKIILKRKDQEQSVEKERNDLKVAQERLKQGQVKLDLDERRLKLLEEKAAEAKAILENVATAAKGGGVTEETIRKIEEAAGLL